jgi:branched-chain amino acid transport system permease protein
MWVALAMAAMFGAILGAPTLRLRGDYLAIVTLGFGEIVPDMATNNLFDQTGGPNGITGIGKPSIFSYSFGFDDRPFYWTLLIVIVIVMVAFRNLERSRVGRAWVAIREDEVAASATGINTVSTKLLAFAIGASVSGFAGAFYGAHLGVVTNEDFSFFVSVTVLSTVVLGGIGSIFGAALGGVAISFIIYWILQNLQEWLTTFGDTFKVSALSSTASNPIDYSQYKYIVYGIILISVMLLRPGGLLPSRARKIELEVGEEVTPLAAVREVA